MKEGATARRPALGSMPPAVAMRPVWMEGPSFWAFRGVLCWLVQGQVCGFLSDVLEILIR